MTRRVGGDRGLWGKVQGGLLANRLQLLQKAVRAFCPSQHFHPKELWVVQCLCPEFAGVPLPLSGKGSAN